MKIKREVEADVCLYNCIVSPEFLALLYKEGLEYIQQADQWKNIDNFDLASKYFNKCETISKSFYGS